MLKKITKISVSLIISFFVFTSTFLPGIAPVFAGSNTDLLGDESMGIDAEESADSLDNSKTSSVPDLGDDQTFPFIPGFGKNSGKD